MLESDNVIVQVLKIRTESLEWKNNILSVRDMDVHLEQVQESLMKFSLLHSLLLHYLETNLSFLAFDELFCHSMAFH